MTIMQVVVSSVILFFLYRYLLYTIGVAKLGVWSVVMATASASRMSELGISGSVVKFVAKYRAHSDVRSVSEVVQTAAISTAVLLSVMLGLLYPIFSWLLKFVIPASDIAEGLAILPYTLISLWCIALAGVFLSGLEGCQRIDLRSWILMGSSIIYLFLTVILVPEFGLIGLAFGQVLQAGIALTISWILLRRELKILPSIPSRWSKRLFKEMIGYGANFQIVSIVGMMFEPVTKGLLSRYGGLAMVGYYEMASRMVLQFRIIIVSANQVLVPVIAALQETAPDRIRIIYRESYRLIVYLSLPLFSGLVAANPVISELWIGAYENTFVLFAMVSPDRGLVTQYFDKPCLFRQFRNRSLVLEYGGSCGDRCPEPDIGRGFGSLLRGDRRCLRMGSGVGCRQRFHSSVVSCPIWYSLRGSSS